MTGPTPRDVLAAAHSALHSGEECEYRLHDEIAAALTRSEPEGTGLDVFECPRCWATIRLHHPALASDPRADPIEGHRD